jgi:hypothetical protein
MRRALGWVVVGGLVAISAFGPAPPRARPAGGIAARLLGPTAGLAASVQWIRVGRAFRNGDAALGFARAEAALALDPGATTGWDLLASYQGFTLASAAHEADAGRRVAWLEAGVATTHRGQARAREPGSLAVTRGLMLLVHAEQDPELPWPGGRAALLHAAEVAFREAVELGRADATVLADACRELR